MSFEAETMLEAAQVPQLDAIVGSTLQIGPFKFLLWLKCSRKVGRLFRVIQFGPSQKVEGAPRHSAVLS